MLGSNKAKKKKETKQGRRIQRIMRARDTVILNKVASKGITGVIF